MVHSIQYLKRQKIQVAKWGTRKKYFLKMIILGLILTTFESTSIFGGSWGRFENQTTIGKFSLPKSVKRSVYESDPYLHCSIMVGHCPLKQ
jgi:hypothetical protein